MIKASVMAATVRRAIQLIPRLTHHNSAQLIKTGRQFRAAIARHLFAKPNGPAGYRVTDP